MARFMATPCGFSIDYTDSLPVSFKRTCSGGDAEAHRDVGGRVDQPWPQDRAGSNAQPAGEQRAGEDDWEDPPHLGHDLEDKQVRGEEDEGLQDVRPSAG